MLAQYLVMAQYAYMPSLEFSAEIPFVENTGRRCVPACAAMILKSLLPNREFSTTEVEKLCGFREDRSTWATQHMLGLYALGLHVGWIQDEDLHRFATDANGFIKNQISDENEYMTFTQVNDITLESQRMKTYLDLGLPFERRKGTREDITSLMLDGQLVRLEVNGKRLAEQEGYANHAVLVSGFSDAVVRLENPDGLYGPKPKQIVTWNTLDEAWEDGTLQYYGSKLVH